ncbi:hypothetical protein B566_EDAN006565 [Ephemera danica]|nr:hypothetical protein B566_EDAN006565 [Ephemera danica]
MNIKEEYVQENIKWTSIDYFNNKVVCELIEGKRPPGIFCVLDDVCATLHAVSSGADDDLKNKLDSSAGSHEHYRHSKEGFTVHHYAGVVTYNVQGFCDRNRDVLFPDLVELMQSSANPFMRNLFPEQISAGSKSRPTTSGTKIRTQANKLVEELMKCTPHYIRCIKPNESKKPKDWEELRVKHQVEYLGLKENIRVRRAGYAYRRPFSKFLSRYAIVTKETWPHWRGDERQGIEHIMRSVNMDKAQYQLGKTKIFIKAPESLFLLEEVRDRKFNSCARIIQAAFKKFTAKKQQQKQVEEACSIVFQKKQRRRFSVNRAFAGDYIGMDYNPALQNLIGRREKVFYAEIVLKYDRRFKSIRRDLILTAQALFLIGREKVKKGVDKGKIKEVVKRRLELHTITSVCVSPLQDDFVLITTKEGYDSLLELVFKTEFLTTLSKKYKASTGRDLVINFNSSMEFRVRKDRWGGGGVRQVKFMEIRDNGDKAELRPVGKTLNVVIGPGLPANYRPQANARQSTSHRTMNHNQNIVKNRPSPSNNPTRSAPRLPSNPPSLRKSPPSGLPPSPPDSPPNLPQRPPGFNPSTKVSTKQTGGRIGHPPPPPRGPTNLRKSPSPMKDTPNGAVQGSINLRPTATANQSVQKEFMKTPLAGVSGSKRASVAENRPVPGGGKPRPAPRVRPNFPKVKALYNYDAQDLDELSFKEGDIIELHEEDGGGWWTGQLRGKKGLFPANYVEKV